MSESYDPMKILSDVRGLLSDASNRLYDLEQSEGRARQRRFDALDTAIDQALQAVDDMVSPEPPRAA